MYAASSNGAMRQWTLPYDPKKVKETYPFISSLYLCFFNIKYISLNLIAHWSRDNDQNRYILFIFAPLFMMQYM